MDKLVLDIIHKSIKYIWEEKIKEDYQKGWLLKEDSLKSALYYHIRTELSSLFEKHNIRIFTEFSDAEFVGTHYRPDMVIATINPDNEIHLRDAVQECLAVIEIKYKSNFNSYNEIIRDYDKLNTYINDLGIKSHFYMATIWEYEDEATTWIRKNASWAKGRVTELNASLIKRCNNEPQFYIYEH